MDAGPLDQLHDAGDKNALAVAHCVHFHLFAADIVVHEDGPHLVDGLGRLQIAAQVRLFGDDLHGAPAQDEAGPHEHGIADFGCRSHAFLHGGDGSPLRLRDPQLLEKLLEQVSVLRPVDGVAVRADDPDAALF